MNFLAVAICGLIFLCNFLQTPAYARPSTEDVEWERETPEKSTALEIAGDCNCSVVHTCDNSRDDSDVRDPPCPASDGDDDSKASGETSVQQSKAALASVGDETQMSPRVERMKRSPRRSYGGTVDYAPTSESPIRPSLSSLALQEEFWLYPSRLPTTP
ncbi:hypothetical protein MTO96_005032 [Rhipicephalus appendiculatus]